LKLLHTLVGGEWILDNKRPDGSAFRRRSVCEEGPDGKNLVFRGCQGEVEGLSSPPAMQV
jgi:hypothetical protein